MRRRLFWPLPAGGGVGGGDLLNVELLGSPTTQNRRAALARLRAARLARFVFGRISLPTTRRLRGTGQAAYERPNVKAPSSKSAHCDVVCSPRRAHHLRVCPSAASKNVSTT